MAKVVPVCSSSKGNSIFIGDTSSGVLVDAGCSFKALKDGLALCGIPFEAVKAVLITHEHIDHTKAIGTARYLVLYRSRICNRRGKKKSDRL